MVPWPIFEHDFVFLDPAVILVRGCRASQTIRTQGAKAHSLMDLFACPPSTSPHSLLSPLV